ncbi:MAG: esterase-like activity of phytase family protein [Acidovorax sp.]|jgi:hypothetical protein|nr:esterase-like activity of phytase family protein [Acidovorax sp.]
MHSLPLHRIAAASLASLLSLSAWAADAPAYPAVLAGHAVLPALSVLPAPNDAPADLRSSGKYTQTQPTRTLASVEGQSNGRPTGIKLPFDGQPLQGHSGIKRMADGSFWIITDNGAGSKANSPDFMLHLSRYKVDFKAGSFQRLETVFLHDPDRKVPFRITQEGSEKRYLTGADFDPESVQIIGQNIWIGEEFGPYLIQADMAGKVLAVFDTLVDGKPVISPDHPSARTPAAPDAKPAVYPVKRSKGFEGMAASPDGKKLYPLLEGPLWKAEAGGAYESENGSTYLRALEFDVAQKTWTGRHWKYPLEKPTHSIGDFNMINATTALVIERDDGEGTPDQACPAGEKHSNCFDKLPQFKRIYKVEMSEANVNGFLRKIGYIDLLNIQDPQQLARKPLTQGVLQFPFFTIENVDVVDGEHIVVGNDNNLPFSNSRSPNQQDDNELVLLNVRSLLQAP